MPPSDKPLLRLGTRRSPLAMAQAEEARRRLCEAHGWGQEMVGLVPVLASGDRIQDRPLADIGGKALWTRELDGWLLDGRIDAAVHSMKDVETVRPDGITIAAMLPRADVRDVLLGAVDIAAFPRGATIGTSAPRRAAQLLNLRPDCRIVGYRGNVATRMAKLAAGEVQGTFLARAGLDRLGEEGVGRALDPAEWLPAPAQGAIGIECRAEDERTRGLLAAIDHAPTHADVLAERAFLAALDGTCHSPIGLWTENLGGDAVTLHGALFSEDGAARVDGSAAMAAGDARAAARLASELLGRAGPNIARLFGTA